MPKLSITKSRRNKAAYALACQVKKEYYKEELQWGPAQRYSQETLMDNWNMIRRLATDDELRPYVSR
mgnify:CR=1 FL=1|jgi:hypothetical protein